MNILHVISAPSPGGVESYIKDLAKEMVSHGHSIHIGFLDRAEDNGTSISYQQEYLEELEAAGVKYFFIGHDARRMPWLGAKRVRSYVKEHGIDLYHAHLTYSVVFAAFIGIPLVYTHHSVDMRVSRLFFRLLNLFIDELVGISEACTNALAENSKREVVTVLNAVNPRKFLNAGRSPRRAGEIINCIAVGRICKEKNYDLLVKAIAQLPADIRSRLIVRIAGDGPAVETDFLKSRIAEENLEETIVPLGNRSDVPALLASSQLYLMTSSTEGMPIALIEAAMSGLPCVVTDVGGCKEVVERCLNGIVVESGDVVGLADAISRVVSDPKLIERFSANALQRSGIFSIENAYDNHVAIYERLLQMPDAAYQN